MVNQRSEIPWYHGYKALTVRPLAINIVRNDKAHEPVGFTLF
jgi:hypothetical protein